MFCVCWCFQVDATFSRTAQEPRRTLFPPGAIIQFSEGVFCLKKRLFLGDGTRGETSEVNEMSSLPPLLQNAPSVQRRGLGRGQRVRPGLRLCFSFTECDSEHLAAFLCKVAMPPHKATHPSKGSCALVPSGCSVGKEYPCFHVAK